METSKQEKVIIALHDQFSGSRIQDFIARHGWYNRTEFHVAHVIEPATPARPADPAWNEARERAHKSASSLLGDFSDTIRTVAPDLEVRQHILEGRAAEELVKLAQDETASLIIMGCRGRKGLKRWLLGSVSHDVAHRAPCSVVILKINYTSTSNGRRN
ncbi:MAG TPA: universal stress protein [Chroococcales cyanobacterium]